MPLPTPERVAQVGCQHRERRRLELVERGEQEEHDERAGSTPAQRLAERYLLGIDAGKEVVGEEDLLTRRGLLSLSLGLRLEHGGGELRGVRRRVLRRARRSRSSWSPRRQIRVPVSRAQVICLSSTTVQRRVVAVGEHRLHEVWVFGS